MEETRLAKKLGLLIRRLRVEAGLSQEEFAYKVGIHRTYAGAVERGEKTVTIETASKFASALDLKLSQMFAMLESQSD